MANYTTMSLSATKYLCSLVRDLASVGEAIDDLHIRSDGCWSSVKIDTLIRQCLQDSNDYTDRLVANLSRLELKIATSESEITQPNIMYLYKPSGSTSYEQYVVIEGTKVLLGTTDINMGDYYTIAQADAKFVLKTDFDSLKTEVDKKVNKTDIVDNLTSTDTDKPLSANQGKVLKDEIDLKANDTDVVKKTNITTTIDENSTDDTVPTAKAVNELNIRGTLIDQSVIDKYGTEIIKYPLGRWYFDSTSVARQFSDIPWGEACIIEITSIYNAGNPWDNIWSYRNYKAQSVTNKGTFVRQLESRDTAGVLVDTGWQRVCTTSVADVPKTTLTLDTNVFSSGTVYYEVRNGICFVSIIKLIPKKSGVNLLISTSVPKSNCYILQPLNVGNVDTIPTQPIVARIGEGETALYIHSINNTKSMYGSFSYPVAES